MSQHASPMLPLVPEPSARSQVPSVLTDVERIGVREQLDRILASPVLRNSKRYPSFLKYIVERTLEGQGDSLKERTIAVEVFGRPPD
jgi:hypothetical protein